jgi:hypothetical protein
MNERDEFLNSPEDQVLDKHLLALKRFTPLPGFEDRVMARVRLPAPSLVKVRQRVGKLVTPRRVWWASGLAAASSTAWILALGSWLSGVGTQAVTAWLTAQVALPLWALALQGAALATKTIGFYALAAWGALGNAVFPVAAAAMLTPVLSMWGLYLTMKQTRVKRIPAYAAR